MIVLVVLLVAAPAMAQVVTNPSSVTFDSPDYALVTAYQGGYFALPVNADFTCNTTAAPATSATATDNLGNPTTSTGVGLSATLGAKPLGCYVYALRAFGGGVYSAWSAPSNPFVHQPRAPANTAVK
jgi:hypothetical protein